MALQGGVSNLNENILRSVQYQVSVSGAAALTDLNDQLDAVQRGMQKADNLLNSGRMTIKQYQEQIAKLAAEERQLQGMITLTNAALANGGAVTDKLVAGLKKSEGAAQKTSYAFFQVAYAIDDMQYGLPALTNNIVGLTAGMFGNSVAVAGVATALTAAAVIYKNWNVIVQAGKDVLLAGIPIQQEWRREMESLEKTNDRNIDQQARLNALKERASAIDRAAIRGKRSQSQEDITTDAIAEAGGSEKLVEKVTGVLSSTTRLGVDEKAEKEIAFQKKMLAEEVKASPDSALAGNKMAMDRRKQLREDIEAMEKEAADKRTELLTEKTRYIVNKAPTSDTQRSILKGIVEKNQKVFDVGETKGLAGGLEMTPEKQLEQQILEEAGGRRQKKIEDKLQDRKSNREALDTGVEKVRQDTVRDVSREMFEGYKKQRVHGIDPDYNAIRSQLETAGFDKKQIDDVAGDILVKLKEEYEQAIRKKQFETGVVKTPKQAEEQLRLDEAEKSRLELERAEHAKQAEAAQAGAKQRKLDLAQNRAVKEQVTAMKPELGKRAKKLLNQHFPEEKVREQMRAAAATGGVPEEFLDEAVDELMDRTVQQKDMARAGDAMEAGVRGMRFVPDGEPPRGGRMIMTPRGPRMVGGYVSSKKKKSRGGAAPILPGRIPDANAPAGNNPKLDLSVAPVAPDINEDYMPKPGERFNLPGFSPRTIPDLDKLPPAKDPNIPAGGVVPPKFLNDPGLGNPAAGFQAPQAAADLIDQIKESNGYLRTMATKGISVSAGSSHGNGYV